MTCIESDNTILYAMWEVVTYKISFETNGGSEIDSYYVDALTTIEMPSTPNLLGYGFMGWYSDIDCNSAYDFNSLIIKDTILYADWEIATLNATFYNFDETTFESVAYALGGYISAPSAIPTRSEYTFLYWTEDNGDTVEFNFFNSINQESIDFVPVFLAATSGLTYTLSNGEYSVSAGTVTAGEIILPDTYGDNNYLVTSIASSGFKSVAITNISFGRNINYIGANAFDGASLTSLVLPEGFTGVDDIGNDSFANNKSLTDITLPNSLETIPRAIFLGCTALEEIIIPSSVTDSVYRAFDGCTSLTKVTLNGDINIGERLFDDCSNLTTIVNGNYIVSIEYGGFYNCSKLTNLDLSGVKTISNTSNYSASGDNTGLYAFKGCSALGEIDLSSATMLEGYVFSTSGITKVTLSGDITTGSNVFESCTSLEAVTVVGGTGANLGSDIFKNCSSIETATMPDTITTIPQAMFYGCSSLSSIDISSVTSIGYRAFYNCDSLAYVILNADVTFMAEDIFHSCDDIILYANFTESETANTGIFHYMWNYKTDTPTYNTIYYSDQWEIVDGVPSLIYYTITFMDGQEKLGEKTILANEVYGTPTDSSLTEKAGYEVTAWYTDSTLDTPYTFENAVTGDITLYAEWVEVKYEVSFETNGGGTIDSTSVSYGSTINSITEPSKDNYTFVGWYTDESLETKFVEGETTITGVTTLYAKWQGDSYTVSFISETGSMVSETVYYGSAIGSFDTIADTDIGDYTYTQTAWYEDQDFTTVYSSTATVTGNVTLYAKWVKKGTEGLIYSNGQVTGFEGDMDSVTTLIIQEEVDGVETTGIAGYSNSSGSIIDALTNTTVTKIEFPSTITSIGEYAFQKFTALETINIPVGVTSLGMAFINCSYIINIYYDGSVEQWMGISLGRTLFQETGGNFYYTNEDGNYELLTQLVIPESVTAIDNVNTFYGFIRLVSIEIHESVTSIVAKAFQYSYNIVEVYKMSSYITDSDITSAATTTSHNVNICSSVEDGQLENLGNMWVIKSGNGTVKAYGVASAATTTIDTSITEYSTRVFAGMAEMTVIFPEDYTVTDSMLTGNAPFYYSRSSLNVYFNMPTASLALASYIFQRAYATVYIAFAESDASGWNDNWYKNSYVTMVYTDVTVVYSNGSIDSTTEN